MASSRVAWTVALTILSAVVAAPAGAAPRSATARLTAFSSCNGLVAYARRGLQRTRGTVGVPVRALGAPVTQISPPAAPGATPAADAVAPAAETNGGSSATNNQESGVDEADLVKTDGRHVFAIVGRRLLAIDVTAAQPLLVGSLDLDGAADELLLRGSRVLVIGADPGAGPVPIDAVATDGSGAAASVRLTEVDVSDPARPTVSRSLTVAGAYVTSRLSGATARVVITSTPRLPVPAAGHASPPQPGIGAFVPRTVIRSRISGRTFQRRLLPCRAIRRPAAFSGLSLVTVLTVDLDKGLYDVDRDAIVAGAQVVYASPRSLYVASQDYIPGVRDTGGLPDRIRTEIHQFDASAAGSTRYIASGAIAGVTLNQYSLSEHGGILRVASTDVPVWLAGTSIEAANTVTTLRREGDQLMAVGRLGGLGAGERIYAVRFIGDVGYVVTFRQTDPLFVVDLADPATPRLAGALKLPGYSAYLHPVGDTLLLGIGRDATGDGRATGVQASLFDVSDPARPRRLAERLLTKGVGYTSVEGDPHAFLWWAPNRTAVLPVTDPSGDPQASFEGAIALRVTSAAITELGRVTHGAPPSSPQIVRALVARGRLVTVSGTGVASASLASLAPLGFTPFPVASPMPGRPGTVARAAAGDR